MATSHHGSNRHDSQNRLLASLPEEDYQRFASRLKTVTMHPKQVLHLQDEPITEIFFPNGGTCSLVKTLENGQMAEVAIVGAESALGVGVFFGQGFAECSAIVQVPSAEGAQAMSLNTFAGEMERRGAFFNHVIRYNQALMGQIMQTTVCNGLHSVEQRCCRWFLMTHDRVQGDEFPVTHEILATMLGVRRPTITLVAATLERAGIVESRRGFVRIVNRSRLESAACECYRTVRTQTSRLLPEWDAPTTDKYSTQRVGV